MLGWAYSVVWTVQGESVMEAGVGVSWGSSWTGLSFGNSLEALNEAMEDICVWGRVQGGAECIASCHCWR